LRKSKTIVCCSRVCGRSRKSIGDFNVHAPAAALRASTKIPGSLAPSTVITKMLPLKRISLHLHVKNCHVTTPFSTSLGPRHTQSTMPGSESHHDNRRMRSASPTQSGLWETAQRFYSKSYAGDYIGLVMLLLVLTFFEFSGEPFHQMFTIDDPRIQHPHAEVERVPVRKFRKSLIPVSTQSL
jgi:hypothetical protein